MVSQMLDYIRWASQSHQMDAAASSSNLLLRLQARGGRAAVAGRRRQGRFSCALHGSRASSIVDGSQIRTFDAWLHGAVQDLLRSGVGAVVGAVGHAVHRQAREQALHGARTTGSGPCLSSCRCGARHQAAHSLLRLQTAAPGRRAPGSSKGAISASQCKDST